MITKKNTNELLRILSSIDSESDLHTLSEELARLEKHFTFTEYLMNKMQEKEIAPARLLESSLIQRNYGYQILNGTKTPGRDKVIALCLALSLSLEETQRALSLAGAGELYPRRRRDSILIYSLERGLSVMETNEFLAQYMLEPLS